MYPTSAERFEDYSAKNRRKIALPMKLCTKPTTTETTPEQAETGAPTEGVSCNLKI